MVRKVQQVLRTLGYSLRGPDMAPQPAEALGGRRQQRLPGDPAGRPSELGVCTEALTCARHPRGPSPASLSQKRILRLGIQGPIWAGDEMAYGCPQATAQCPCGKCHVRDPGTLGYEIKVSPMCLAADLQVWGPVGSGPGSGQPLPNTVLSSSSGRGAHLREIGPWRGWPS